MQSNLTRAKTVHNLAKHRSRKHPKSLANGHESDPIYPVHELFNEEELELAVLDEAIDFSSRYLYEVDDRNYQNWVTELRRDLHLKDPYGKETPPVREYSRLNDAVHGIEEAASKKKLAHRLMGGSANCQRTPTRRYSGQLSNSTVQKDYPHGEQEHILTLTRASNQYQSRSMGTDTDDLKLIQEMATKKLLHETEILQYRVEIAEAQTMIFHLSEQLQKAQRPLAIPLTTNTEQVTQIPNSAPPTKEFVIQSNEKASIRLQRSNEGVEFKSKTRTEGNKLPDKPQNLHAERLTLDNRWLISWAGPPLENGEMNQGHKIHGYQVNFNGLELKRVDSPLLTKCIIQLGTPDNAVPRGVIGVQTIGEEQTSSEPAYLELWNTEEAALPKNATPCSINRSTQ